jgi:hypothetical protein
VTWLHVSSCKYSNDISGDALFNWDTIIRLCVIELVDLFAVMSALVWVKCFKSRSLHRKFIYDKT